MSRSASYESSEIGSAEGYEVLTKRLSNELRIHIRRLNAFAELGSDGAWYQRSKLHPFV